MMDITEAELIKAAQEYLSAVDNPAPGFEPGTISTPAFAAKEGISKGRARKTLDNMCRDGLIRPDKVEFTNPWGNKQHIPGWRWVD